MFSPYRADVPQPYVYGPPMVLENLTDAKLTLDALGDNYFLDPEGSQPFTDDILFDYYDPFYGTPTSTAHRSKEPSVTRDPIPTVDAQETSPTVSIDSNSPSKPPTNVSPEFETVASTIPTTPREDHEAKPKMSQKKIVKRRKGTTSSRDRSHRGYEAVKRHRARFNQKVSDLEETFAENNKRLRSLDDAIRKALNMSNSLEAMLKRIQVQSQ